MSYKVKLDIFEGPFDLLVYLIESARMSIYDIQVAEITAQYLNYLDKMNEPDVNISSEFLVLAAELVDIKSKMLLPQRKSDEEDGEYEDPRTNLVARLLEYKKFKSVSEKLQSREEFNMHIYEKPQEDISEFTDASDEYLTLKIEDFIKAFRLFLEKKKKVEDMKGRYEHMAKEKASAEEKMKFIKNIFLNSPGKEISFTETIQDSNDKYDKALSFSSILEMIRQNQVIANQKRLYGEIMVSATDRIGEEIALEDNKNMNKE